MTKIRVYNVVAPAEGPKLPAGYELMQYALYRKNLLFAAYQTNELDDATKRWFEIGHEHADAQIHAIAQNAEKDQIYSVWNTNEFYQDEWGVWLNDDEEPIQ